jgi:hypothetical protein
MQDLYCHVAVDASLAGSIDRTHGAHARNLHDLDVASDYRAEVGGFTLDGSELRSVPRAEGCGRFVALAAPRAPSSEVGSGGDHQRPLTVRAKKTERSRGGTLVGIAAEHSGEQARPPKIRRRMNDEPYVSVRMLLSRPSQRN